jgi:hypothetical protein
VQVKLNILHQFSNATSEGFGDSQQSRQGDMLFAAFDPTHIIGMKVGPFGQLFLAQPHPLPLLTDGCSKNDTVIRTRPHRYTQPQTVRALYTAKRMIFLWFSYCIGGNMFYNRGQLYENRDRKRPF